MRRHLSATVLVMATMLAASGQERVPMPCLQLVPVDLIRTVLGDGMTLNEAFLMRPGESHCFWSRAANLPVRLRVTFIDRRGFPKASPTSAGAYDEYAAELRQAGIPVETTTGVGEAALLARPGDLLTLVVRRADGVFSVSATNVEQERLLNVAKRAASAPSPRLGEHPRVPERAPAAPATALTLSPEQQRAPCVRVLPPTDVKAEGRKELLVEVLHPRPAFSACTWRTTVDEQSGFSLTVVTEPEFMNNDIAGPAAYFAAERKLLGGDVQPITGVGVEAVIAESKYTPPVLLIRRATDVLRLSCYDWTCSRDVALALMRRAVAR
jgi:hypothetical protein